MADSLNIPKRGNAALLCLDRAVHPNTGWEEVRNAIEAYRRIAEGSTVSFLCDELFGGNDLLLDGERQGRVAQLDAEITRLKQKNRQLKQALNNALAQINQSINASAGRSSGTVIDLTNAEWVAVATIFPEKKRTTVTRERIATILWVLRTNPTGGWRSLPTWTTYYNAYRLWTNTGIWEQIITAINTVN